MSSKRNRLLVVIVILFGGLVLASCRPEIIVEQVEVTRVVEKEVEVTKIVAGETVVETVFETVIETVVETVEVEAETPTDSTVVLNFYDTDDLPTLDPQIARDMYSVTYIENLFVQLTNYDLETSNVIPEAATHWEISEDGLVYTFYLRTDIPWVKYHPITELTSQEVDDEGNPRFVTAQDFVYGIKRACDPDIGSYYSTIVAPFIKNCSDLLFAEDPKEARPERWNAIGVSAPDDSTLVIELEFPAAYFLSMTPLWTLAASPQWAIEAHGDDWIEAGNIVTNGRYVLGEWVHNARLSIVRNPLAPAELRGSGNVDRVDTTVVPDISVGYALWLNNEVDASFIPALELEAHREQFPNESLQIPTLAVSYFGFRMSKFPFDDVRVRRAFSAALDRERLVRDVRQGQGLPMIHLAPPGIFGAPPIEEVGISYDPDFARAQMAEAGYPDCENFPVVTLLTVTGQAVLPWVEFAQATITEVLGCEPDRIQIQQAQFRELLAAIEPETPDDAAPHMWTLTWAPDYADENNWVGDVLWCDNLGNRFKRACSEVDEWIVQAREELDPSVRIELYRQIEERFFGNEGLVPMIPQYVSIATVARHSWLDLIPALFAGDQYYNWSLDWDAKMDAQGD